MGSGWLSCRKSNEVICMNKILIAVLIGLIIVVSGCTSQQTGQQVSSANLDSFAQCLTEKEVKMYGSYTCSACAAQKKSFGDSWKYVTYVECNPRGPSPQVELCLTRNIEKTPTWILEENNVEKKRVVGFQVLDDLATFSGCPLGG